MKKAMLFLIMISMCFSSFAVEPYFDSEDPDEIFIEYCKCEKESVQNTIKKILEAVGVDDCSKALNKLKTIKSVNLNSTPEPPFHSGKTYHLGPLKSLENLSKLTIRFNLFDGLETISKLTSLTELSVSFLPKFDFRLLYPLEKLSSLTIKDHCYIEDYSPLIVLKDRLKELYLGYSSHPDTQLDVSMFNGFTKLESLAIDGLNLKGFKDFVNIPNLKYLDIAYSKGVDLWMLREVLPNLEELIADGIGAKNIDILAAGKNLKLIYLTENQIESLLPISYLEKIESLFISDNPIDPNKCPTDSSSKVLNTICQNMTP